MEAYLDDLNELVNKALEIAKRKGSIPSRHELMKELKISETLARDIKAIVKYLLNKNEVNTNYIKNIEINPVDIIDLPKPIEEPYREPYKINGYRRIGILSDIHLPYHDNTALKTALKKLYEYEVDTIILNGDIVDFYSVSFWERDPDKRNLQRERELSIKALTKIREIFRDVNIIYKEGNHEERLEKFLSRKAPELYQVEELKVDKFIKLDDMNISYINNKKRIEAGDLDIIHGHEYRSFASVNIAISFLRKTFQNVLLGHFHKKQEDTKRSIRDSLSGAWVVGCLCHLKPDYSPNNDWTHGFAFIELFDNGHFQVYNHLIQGEEVF